MSCSQHWVVDSLQNRSLCVMSGYLTSQSQDSRTALKKQARPMGGQAGPGCSPGLVLPARSTGRMFLLTHFPSAFDKWAYLYHFPE